MIYLDNAATTRPKPPGVAEAVAAAMNDYGNSGRGTHPEALEAARSIYGVRQALAALFGCSRADRVAFTPNSTMALNIAISGLLGAGDHVISTDLEHNSVLRPLYRLRAQGGAVDFVPADRQGRIDYEDFERLLRPNTKAVVCTHGSNLTGDLMDIQRVGNFCQKHRLLFILDASQTAGVFPIDMERQHISVVCFTGHKSLMGPQGTGGLCVGAGVEIRPFAVGGTGVQSYSETQPEAYPTRLEAGTLNSHGIAGLGASLAFLKRTGRDAVRMHESVLARRFYETVRTIPGVKVYGNFAVQLRAPIVSLNIADLDSSEVADELAERFEIATRPGAHCAPRLHRALGTEDQGAVRFSWLVEIALIKLCKPEMETDQEAVLDRIRQVEEKVENGIVVTAQMPAGAPGVQGGAPGGAARPKPELPKAIPEDVQEIVRKWPSIVGNAENPMKMYLKNARLSLGGDNKLMVVLEDGLASDYFKGEAHEQNKQQLEALLSDFSGKEIEVTIQTVENSREFEDNYVDLSKVINMEIDEEE